MAGLELKRILWINRQTEKYRDHLYKTVTDKNVAATAMLLFFHTLSGLLGVLQQRHNKNIMEKVRLSILITFQHFKAHTTIVVFPKKQKPASKSDEVNICGLIYNNNNKKMTLLYVLKNSDRAVNYKLKFVLMFLFII